MDMKLKLDLAKEIASEESDIQKVMKLDMDMKLKLDQAKVVASKENDNLQKMYREVLAAKAALVAGSSSGVASANENDQKAESRRKMNKRPAPSSPASLPTSSLSVRPSAVVSDSGSDISSSSSCASSVDNIAVKIEKTEAVSSVSRGGSRLKRLKLRMKSDFN